MSDECWERFAREDAEYYVLTDIGRGRRAETRSEFFESGRKQAERLLEDCKPYLNGRDLAIEIGCGVGRVALPLSRQFARLIAVDISPTMLSKLETNAARDAGAGRIQTMLARQAWDNPNTADLVYSVLVFQHIESFEEIARYVERISLALKPRGVAYLQFDTRPRTLLYRGRNLVPDPLLPRSWRKGIRRIRRVPESLRNLFRAHGLHVCHELGRESEYHAFVLRSQ
jgi:SAM-dependent methyltransferase